MPISRGLSSLPACHYRGEKWHQNQYGGKNTERPHQASDYPTPARVSNSIHAGAIGGVMLEYLAPDTRSTAGPEVDEVNLVAIPA